MRLVGRVESLWRYPVKSMRGEQLDEAFLKFSGVHGDRLYAFHSTAAAPEFPYFTAREQGQMLRYQPRCRKPAPGSSATAVDVETPAGACLSVHDPRLIPMLREGVRETHEVTLLQSEDAMTDCHPVSLLSIQTVAELSRKLQMDLDKRRFRANIYLDLISQNGFEEDTFVGHTLRIGAITTIKVMQRDQRCKMITLDPETAQPEPEIARHLARAHDNKAGIYASVQVEGAIRPRDEVILSD